MLALISDIHGNLEALSAVIADIEKYAVNKILCLGDIVGYGPDPVVCTDIVMEHAQLALMGNHEYALIHGPVRFNPIAADAIRLIREIMVPNQKKDRIISMPDPEYPVYPDNQKGKEPQCLVMEHSKSQRWQFIQNLSERMQKNEFLFVHASPLDPIFKYVLPDSFGTVWNKARIIEQFQPVKRLCFCGHTHIPCAITSDLECIYPPQCNYQIILNPKKKYIINTGSVGQPRDHDSRACYLLFDLKDNRVQWRRVEYDIQETVKKSEAMYGQDNWCALRLLSGK